MAASTGVTTFRIAPSDGSVAVANGGGARISTGSARFMVSIPCLGKQCANANTIVTVGSIGTPTGRAGALTNFTVFMGAATLVSGPSGTNPVTFTLGPIGLNNTATFYVGADFPIYGDDSSKSTGAASSSIYVQTTSSSGKNLITSQGAATSTVDRSLSISASSQLNFGWLTLPTSGTSSVTLSASTGARTISGTAWGTTTPTPTRGVFTVAGEGGQTISVAVPASIMLTNGSSGSLTVTTSNTAQGAPILSNSSGSGGSFSFDVGGALSLAAATPRGTYSGVYTITVSYN